ncbi:MAG: toprim domain-containing protein [Planctomycetota bacterium]|jgi:5S rRNA maturation endonuclease (ribonuclease M5)
MRAEAIKKLLDSLGCDKIRDAPKGVRSSCPFGPWNHSRGEDKHPSFLVYEKVDDISRAGCLSSSCRFKGDLNDLLYKLQKLSGRDLSAQLLFVSQHNNASHANRMKRIEASSGWYSTPSETTTTHTPWTGGKDYSDPAVLAELHPPLPASADDHVEKMISLLNDEVIDYLTGPDRRFTMESIAKWKLGWHPAPRRVSVPQYDNVGRLVNIGGRYIRYWDDIFPTIVPAAAREDRVPKWMHSLGFERDQYLFGEDWFESTDGKGTVFIVEGAFDVIYLTQCGLKNVAAINGSHVNKPQVAKILKWFDSVVLVMDGDGPGRDAAMRLQETFSQQIHVATYLIPDGRDPNKMTDEEIQDLKTRFVH